MLVARGLRAISLCSPVGGLFCVPSSRATETPVGVVTTALRLNAMLNARACSTQRETREEDVPEELTAMFADNKRWREKTQIADPDYFEQLAKDHKPEYLWIGCSDARVPANTITGLELGSVFVHRNIANLVVNNDMNLMSVIQYAVDVLDVKHIMVCGHYDCGGIKAAMTKKNHKSPLDNWIRNIRDVMRLHKDELASMPDEVSRYRRLVELNVLEQCINVFKTHTVQRRRTETFRAMKRGLDNIKFTYPRVHGLVFQPWDGELKALPVSEYLALYADDLKSIYEVYAPGQDTMNMP